MREIAERFERVDRDDRIDKFEENTNIFTDITDTNKFTLSNLAENQPVLFEDKVMFKKDGVIKELVIENNIIILKEI